MAKERVTDRQSEREPSIQLEVRKEMRGHGTLFHLGQDFQTVDCERVDISIISKSPKPWGFHDQRKGATTDGAFAMYLALSQISCG